MLILREDGLPHGEADGGQADLSCLLFLLQTLQNQTQVEDMLLEGAEVLHLLDTACFQQVQCLLL